MWSSVATLAHAACCTWHHRQRTSHYRNRTSHYRSPNACKTPAGLSNHGPATARPKVSFSSPASLIRLGFLSPLRRFLPYLTTTRDPPQNVYAKRGASKARTYCRSKCRCGTVTRCAESKDAHQRVSRRCRGTTPGRQGVRFVWVWLACLEAGDAESVESTGRVYQCERLRAAAPCGRCWCAHDMSTCLLDTVYRRGG